MCTYACVVLVKIFIKVNVENTKSYETKTSTLYWGKYVMLHSDVVFSLNLIGDKRPDLVAECHLF